jgi:thiol-disulfide isomerase/thioredoxin
MVAGLNLGCTRAANDSLLGKADDVRTASPGVQLFLYRARGLALAYLDPDTLGAIYLLSREAGNIGEVRVGDFGDSVAARWGEPAAIQENLRVYQVGNWVVAVQLDSSSSHVALLALGFADEETGTDAAGPYDSTANARQSIEDALRESREDGKLVLLDFGANWCLDCLVLDRLFQDSTVAEYLRANFRVVRVAVGRFDRNLDIAAAYGDPIANGVPAAVVLSPSGEIVASTNDGSLESARKITPEQMLRFLQSWVSAAHR